jgi:hypothetical protein
VTFLEVTLLMFSELLLYQYHETMDKANIVTSIKETNIFACMLFFMEK